MTRTFTLVLNLLVLSCLLLTCGCASEEERWDQARTADTVQAYETFRGKYPDSPHDAEAIARIEELDWSLAEEAETEEAFQGFLERYPQSERSETARERIDLLRKTAIHRAAENGELAELESLLDAGIDINTIEGARTTPLHVASGKCGLETMELLIERGADVNQRGGDDSTPLHWATRSGCLPVMRRLIEAGADIDVAVRQPLSGIRVGDGGSISFFGGYNDAVRGSALHWAAEYRQPEAAALLIESGADVNLKTGWGMYALHFAADSADDAIVAMLLEHGARWHDPKLKNGQPIHYSGSPAIAQRFEQEGEKLDADSAYRGKPIHNAAYLGHREVVEFFLERGADVDLPGSWNMDSGWTGKITPSWAAAYGGQLETLKLLESRGGNLGFSPENGGLGGTLLHAAAWQGHDEVIRYLVSRGQPVEERAEMPTVFPLQSPWEGMTPLATAAHFGHVPSLEALAEAGADVKTVNADNWSALELAIISDRTDAVEFLLDHGATLDLTKVKIDRLNTTDEIKEMLKERLQGAAPTP